MKRRDTPLSHKLKDRIRSYGPMTFRDFMAASLYDSQYGFYVQGPAIGAPDGPFDTNAKFPAFSFALAQAFQQVATTLGQPTRIIELGGGTGHLGKTVLKFLKNCMEYVVVDPSPGLRAQQEQSGLQTVRDVADLPPSPSVVFANEVLDALPVHKVMGIGEGKLLEFYVALDKNEEFWEFPQEPSSPAIGNRFKHLNIELSRGQVGEVCLELEPLFEKLSKIIDPGYIIFVDYGEIASNLYAYQRRNGTLRTFYRQKQIHDIFYAIGEQDLTADVDFTSVRLAAQRVHLEGGIVLSQGDWLDNLGVRRYEPLEGNVAQSGQEIEILTKSSMLGSAFSVMIFQTTGLPLGPGVLGDRVEMF